MRSSPLVWTLVLALVPAAFTTAQARNLNYTNNVNDENGRLTCSDMEMRIWSDGWNDVVNVRRERTLTLRATGSTPLRVTAAERGGVRVQPSTDGSISAVVCMIAAGGTHEACERILDMIDIVNSGGELRVNGPDGDEWAAEVILSVPKGTTLDMSAVNGPLSIRDVSGRFTLRTTNGPIVVAGVDGTVDADTQNGPIKFRGHAGDIRLAAQNGPVKVDLDAVSWSGKGLDASTQNGPIKLDAPQGLKTGVQVRGSSWSPARWNGEAYPLDEPGEGGRSFRLGQGAILVRISTQHGPIHIDGPKRSRSSRGTWI